MIYIEIYILINYFSEHYIFKTNSLDRHGYKKHVIGNVKKDYHYRYL